MNRLILKLHKVLLIRVVLFAVALCFFIAAFGKSSLAALPAIPNAPFQEGFGMDTPAGSGRSETPAATNICVVNDLTDRTATGEGVGGYNAERGVYEGDLRYCLRSNVSSPKTIIFEKSGTITLNGYIIIGSAGSDGPVNAEAYGRDITIAGQTAPSPGITIKGYKILIERNAHDILIQHIRFRGGEDLNGCLPDYADVLTIDNHAEKAELCTGVSIPWSCCTGVGTGPTCKDHEISQNIVIDHCSFSWSVDENIETGAENITFSNNIISEGLRCSSHSKGCHSKGLITLAYNHGVVGSWNTAIMQNIFSHNYNRNPLINAGSAVVANNLIYDFHFGPQTDDHAISKGYILASIVGNYIISTDNEHYPMYICGGVENTRIHLGQDNYFRGAQNKIYKIQTDPWSEILTRKNPVDISAGPVPEYTKVTNPVDAVWISGYEAMKAADAYAYVLKNAGARPADRDATDQRIIGELTGSVSDSGAFVDCVDCTNADCIAEGNPYQCCTGLGTGNCYAAPGGWPILAENTRILALPANPTEIQPSGYTKLEEWLHGFSRIVEGESVILGDVTGDSLTNIQDTQACVNHILGIQDWGAAANVNGIGGVDVTDVQCIVNIILCGDCNLFCGS